MGYQKIVQYGDTVEHYQYEKNLNTTRRRHVSEHSKKRAKERRLYAQATGTYKRPWRSVKRSQANFYRMCHHNNHVASTIHFLTITFAYDLTYKEAGRHVARFLAKIKSRFKGVPIAYVSVPELTKKGRYHFHSLVYNLPSEEVKKERVTRNFQRQFERGYIDFSPTTYRSEGLAGYMAKYMGKALVDDKSGARRGYISSRKLDKGTSAGSNSLTEYMDMIIPTDTIVQTKKYEVPFLGTCIYTKIKKQ